VLLVQAKIYCREHAAGKAGVVKGGGVSCTKKACFKTPTFGYPGQRAIYCKNCIPAKLKGQLVGAVSRRCEHADCFTYASFGSTTDRVSAALLFVC
jgi:hypothetical protein